MSAAKAGRPRVGVSACLLGRRVRWDGDHRHAPEVCAALAREVTLVPFCPEVEVALGVPRPPIRVVERDGERRVLGVEDPSLDVTVALRALADDLDARLGPLDGWVLKSRSPSCGLRDTDVHDAPGRVVGRGSGAFAAALAAHRPDFPLEDERHLRDPAAREDFLARVRAHHQHRSAG
ncbi:MAG: DUF523 domain-containing protein [Myxococcota bacterium]